jgi:hypothetical protein
MTHATFETLNDLADGVLPPEEQHAVEAHLRDCDVCRAQVARLHGLLGAVARVPRVVDPPDDLWRDIRAQIESRRDVSLGAPVMGGRGTVWWARARLAAAAVVLVAASSWITARVVRSGNLTNAPVPPPRVVVVPALPFTLAAMEDGYMRAANELQAALDAQGGRLSPATIATVKRSISVIDSAIVEAHSALAADPGNRDLVDLLAAHYQRKVELLRRATELPSHT